MSAPKYNAVSLTDAAQLASAMRKWMAGYTIEAEELALFNAGYLKLIPGAKGAMGATAKGWHEAQNPKRVSESEAPPYSADTYRAADRVMKLIEEQMALPGEGELTPEILEALEHVHYRALDDEAKRVSEERKDSYAHDDMVPPGTEEERMLAIRVLYDALYAVSPEDETHLWKCTCGNSESFVGMDDGAFPGDGCESDDCPRHALDDDEEPDADALCNGETTLTQDFTVGRFEDGTFEDYHYQAFTGGGDDAEITGYDRIYCSCCNRLLWIGPDAWPEMHEVYREMHPVATEGAE